jgi:hypothetical protein
MNEKELFGDKPWLETHDIPNGRAEITIEHVEKTPTGKNLLFAYELEKPITLFWHTYQAIKKILGEADTKDWEDKKLIITTEVMTTNGGEEKEVFKFEAVAPVAAAKPKAKQLPSRRKRDMMDEASERLLAAHDPADDQ